MPPERVTLLSWRDPVWAAGAVLSELRRGGRLGAPREPLIVLRRVPDDGLVECECEVAWSDDGRRTLPNMLSAGEAVQCNAGREGNAV